MVNILCIQFSRDIEHSTRAQMDSTSFLRFTKKIENHVNIILRFVTSHSLQYDLYVKGIYLSR